MSVSWFLESVRMMGSWQRVIMSTDKIADNLTLGRLFWIIHVGPVYSQGSLKGKEGNKRKLERWWCEKNLAWCAGFEDGGSGREPQPSEAGEGKETDSPRELSLTRTKPWAHLDFCPGRLILGSDFKNSKISNLCCLSHQVCRNLLQKQKERTWNPGINLFSNVQAHYGESYKTFIGRH